ncbi:MAG: glycosyl transferase group 1 [Bacteroidota bacterium]|jgi:glycosyltransferase involved in cell wall biosynthesis|nr:glycosyl transferase group 1 [Bacteroidota bacterium]
MNTIYKIAYILFFWALFLIVKILTLLFKILPVRLFIKYINKNNKRILYLDPFFKESAGTRYRIDKWIPSIEKNSYKVIVKNVYNEELFLKLLNGKNDIVKFQAGFILSRLLHLFYAVTCKTVIVRRTILLYNEYGQGTFMESLLNTMHPNVILDFDDDMQIQDQRKTNSLFPKLLLEDKNKFYKTLNKYERFIVGSEYLKNLVLKHNNRVLLSNILTIPTCVDYDNFPPKEYNDSTEIAFGWIGSNSNLVYLDAIIAPLNSIAKEFQIKLVVISGKEYQNSSANFTIENISWSLETEKENLRKIDIGLMPLYNTEMEKGKCGFKLIQYMGLGIVSVASAITINKEIIDDNINGFLVSEPAEWEAVLRKVILRRKEFPQLGDLARKKVSSRFSFHALAEPYLQFITTTDSNITFKERVRQIAQLLSYHCFYIFLSKNYERTRNNIPLKPGVSAVVSAKDEEVSIRLALQSLIGFADQIICIDNGSEDNTLKIMNEFKAEFGKICDIEILIMPDALLGDCREAGLEKSTHQWHLRWDADMIFKTSGTESSRKLRELVLRTKEPIAFQLGRTNLFGDFYHCSKFYEVSDRGEPFLVRFSKEIKYREFGRFDAIKLPIYYKIVNLTDKYIFHCDGIKPDLRLIYRNCYFDWRQKYNAASPAKKIELSDFRTFEKEWQLKRYKTNETGSLIFRYQKESLMHLKRYDPETYGAYPEILSEYMKKGQDRFKIIYRDNKPYKRTDALNPAIENYVPTGEDLNFDPIDYLKEVLPKKDLYKLL